VEYLGHTISGQGLQPTDEKIQAIKKAPAPQDVTQLKSFLGLLNYYSKFLPNLSNTLAPPIPATSQKHKMVLGTRTTEGFSQN